MKIFSTFILLVVVFTLTSSVEAGKKGKRKKRNKNKQPGKIPTNLKTDPTDLADLITTCSDNGQLPALFSGMFLSETKLDELVNATQEEMNPRSRTKAGKKGYVQSNRISKKISTVQTFAATRGTASTDQTCCETELRITAPGQVMLDGKSMSVVHMNHSYQYVQEGECITPGATCRDIGICTQRYKNAFMLLYDPDLIGEVNPPVRYGKVSVKSHCECMNIGRATQ